MCQRYFGLTEAPFSIAPDPRYLYMSQRHQEALATLLFGVNGSGGFVLLTGDVGAGKTTICRCLLDQIPEGCDVAYIFNPKLTEVELLSTICDEFRIPYQPGNTSIKLFVDYINAYLLDSHARGRRAVLIIDEAQNLSAGVLEQMRLLTNLETHQRKLLQIILLGQPELATMLQWPELRQLAQRIVARYHLGPLTRAEVKSYVRYRLEVSGAQRQLFPDSLMGQVHRLSRGVPRVINTLCDRALLGTFVQNKERVDRATLKQAAREVLPQSMFPHKNRRLGLIAGLILIAGSGLAASRYQQAQREPAAALPVSPRIQAVADTRSIAALPTTLDWPARLPRSSSQALAHAELLQAWGAEYRDGVDLCLQAAGLGLSCRTARGGLDDLGQLNRPAILHLHDRQGQTFDATLTRLGDQTATFRIGRETMTVARGALAFQWSGDYTLLWRPPPELHRNLRIGESGPTVNWLSKQLALAQGSESGARENPVVDNDLMQRIKQFQLTQGLLPDGVAGPQTLVRLSSVADQAAPRLFNTRGED
jgi:general secretion pathway protein A